MRIRRPGLTLLSLAVTLAVGTTVSSRTQVDALLERARAGDAGARVELAKIYTAQEQRELAIEQLKQAAAAGNSTASALLVEQFLASKAPGSWEQAKVHANAAAAAGTHEPLTRVGVVASLRAIDEDLPKATREAYARDAAQLLVTALQAGNRDAQWHLGYLYVTGVLPGGDEEGGMAMIFNAADAGHAVAARWLSHVYDQISLTGKGRIGVPLPMADVKAHAVAQSLHYLKAAAVAGNRHAMTELAERYARGDVPGGRADPERAARLLQVVNAGTPAAPSDQISSLGGLGPSLTEAAFKDAAASTPGGQAVVVRPLTTHVGAPHSTVAAATTTTTHPAIGFEPVNDSAIVEDLRAQLRAQGITLTQTKRELELALRRVNELEGQLVEFGKFQALRSSADERNRKGLEFYALGDYESALPHFRAAAELDHAGAVANLALLYLNGHAVPQDMKQAARLLQRAVELGNLVAAENLAELYETGAGLGYDPSRAIVWYRRALALGSTKASAALVRLGAGAAQ